VDIVDSFAFFSREWNEDRREDTKLFAREPFDPALGLVKRHLDEFAALVDEASAREITFETVGTGGASGFTKTRHGGAVRPARFAGGRPHGPLCPD